MFCDDDMQYNSFDAAEDNIKLASECYSANKYPQAIDALDKAIAADPVNSTNYFNKALTLESMGNFEQAVENYQAVIDFGAADLETFNAIAVNYTRTGFYDKAIALFSKIQRTDNMYEQSFCSQVITFIEMREHDKAEQAFYLAQQINPDCPLCFYNIGNSLYMRGDFKRAEYCWKKTAELENDHPQINYRIAQTLWAQGQSDEAKKYFLAELKINPGDIEVILDYALFCLENNQIDSAKEKFHRILEIDSNNASALFYLGEIAKHEGKNARASALYNDAMRKNPDINGPRYRLAEFALEAKDYTQVKAFLTSELSLHNNNAQQLISIASMFIAIGELDYATNSLLSAIDIDDKNSQAYYYLGVVSFLNQRKDDALNFFDQAIRLCPDHLDSMRDSALVFLSNFEPELAQERIKTALKKYPADKQLKTVEKQVSRMLIKEKITQTFRTANNPAAN